VSLGAEEVCHGGIHGLGARHFPHLDRERTNYHLMSDTPDNLDYGTAGRAVTVTEAVARELAGH
jgi:hypothetical protein